MRPPAENPPAREGVAVSHFQCPENLSFMAENDQVLDMTHFGHRRYSYRSASMGSRREARTAGTIPLISPTAPRISVATIRVVGAMIRLTSPASAFFAMAL